MIFFRFALVVLFASTFAACSTSMKVDDPQAGSFLTEDQIRQYKELAKKNDQEAIGRLYGNYSFGSFDLEKSNYWLKRYAYTGEPSAEYNYGQLLYEAGKKREGLRWVERSAQHGFYAAPDFLKQNKQ